MPASKQSGGAQTSRTAAGATALVALCCGGHALVLGAFGSVALGSVLGLGAGVLAAAVLLAAALVVIRRRWTASCPTDPGRSPRR